MHLQLHKQVRLRTQTPRSNTSSHTHKNIFIASMKKTTQIFNSTHLESLSFHLRPSPQIPQHPSPQHHLTSSPPSVLTWIYCLRWDNSARGCFFCSFFCPPGSKYLYRLAGGLSVLCSQHMSDSGRGLRHEPLPEQLSMRS